jgi:putative heme-binding domain-containing protein
MQRNSQTPVAPFLFFTLLLSCAISGVLQASPPDREQLLQREADRLIEAEQDPQWIRMIVIDLELSTDPSEASQATCRRILRSLALSGDETAQEHVLSVFENEPERRSMAAWALSQASLQHPADLRHWQLMVRSLTVVEGSDAVSVMQALKRFRVRANKAQWVRQVILKGLPLAESEQLHAASLLQHWTAVPEKSAESWTLAQYQEWFQQEYPDAAPAVLPVDLPDRRWTMAKLMPGIHEIPVDDTMLKQGAAVFESAGCAKCHRRGATGSANGPDLTTLGWRRQKSEILKSLLYPSHELNEEYPTVTVVFKDGTIVSGLLQAAARERLSVFTTAAEKKEFAASEVEMIRSQAISAMPEGTLELLSLEQIQSLVAWLTSVDGIPKPHAAEIQE